MLRRFIVFAAAALSAVALLTSTAAARSPRGFVLSTTRAGGPGFAPAFVGNGYLAGRQPADGQGYGLVPLPGQTKPLATQSEVQGLYAKVDQPDTGPIERRAALPAWSELTYDDGSGPYTLTSGGVRDFRQSLDLYTGTLTTQLTWTSPAGRTVALRYDVTPDRARPHAALVRLRFVPRFSGPVAVTDVLDGRAAEFTTTVARGHAGRAQWVDLVTEGLSVRATEASVLTATGGATPTAVPAADPQTAAQRLVLHVRSGHAYVVTKSVGVAVSTDASAHRTPHARALGAALAESRLGYAGARRGSDARWRALWASDIVVRGDARLQRQVRSSLFALLASTRDDVAWAPSPGGLSSDGYNGHVFWDSETWMYPTLLATEPAIARKLLQYRADRLAAARQNAAATGYAGARYPWESALTGSEQTPDCCDTGKLEVHVSSDIALAIWQYWLATGDRRWLQTTGWPMLAGIADFWVSRSTANADGSRSIDGVIPPDEYQDGIDDSVYTNVAARDALEFAVQAARLTGHAAPAAWTDVSSALRVPFDPATGTHPEFAGYTGGTVKQADVTLLAYPWENAQPPAITRADLEYYVPRTDPSGPSMTDAIHSILASQLGIPGCSAYAFTKRSIDPFMRGPYEQFSESRTGGAFTFHTGAGGFVQEFLYGYAGLRWRATGLRVDPSLPPQLTGITLKAVHWRGRTLRVDIGPRTTTVRLLHGRAMRILAPTGDHLTVRPGLATLRTRRPGSAPTSDLARCRPATATPATADPAVEAVDGLVASAWTADTPGTRLQVDLGRPVPIGSIVLDRPGVLAIPNGQTSANSHALTGPTQSAGEAVEVSADGSTWRTLATVAAPPVHESFAGGGVRARFVRVVAGADTSATHPFVIGELSVTR